MGFFRFSYGVKWNKNKSKLENDMLFFGLRPVVNWNTADTVSYGAIWKKPCLMMEEGAFKLGIQISPALLNYIKVFQECIYRAFFYKIALKLWLKMEYYYET